MEKHKCILLRETCLKNATYYGIPTILHSGKGKTIEIVKKISTCQGFEERGGKINLWNPGGS